MRIPQIIRQNQADDAVPDFRSLGVQLRVLLAVNLGALLLAYLRSNAWQGLLDQYIQLAALVQPVLLFSLLLLYVANPYLASLKYRTGMLAVMGVATGITLITVKIGRDLYFPVQEYSAYKLGRMAVISGLTAALLLEYLRLRKQALAPALHQARAQALQARIRPHFLFNCINTVLSIVRGNPKRAETALEDMSDLFRMAMADDQALVLIRREIELTERYLALEKLRLGERLSVSWQTDGLPRDAMCPPLILQPLLENAVYHGIEPQAEGGRIDVVLGRRGGEIRIEITNPCKENGESRSGNKLALENIRERLKLIFDIEAQYTVEHTAHQYRVLITMPYIQGEAV